MVVVKFSYTIPFEREQEIHMIIFNQDVVNNFFYILLSIFLVFFLVEKRFIRGICTKMITFLSLSGAMILCMLSPIYMKPYCIHDLRMIPFVLGIMYAGPYMGLALFLSLLAGRTFIYQWSWTSFVIYGVIYILTVAALKLFRFDAMKSRKRIFFSVCLFTIHSIAAASIATVMTEFRVDGSYILNFILLPSVGMLFFTYICEILVKQVQVKHTLMKIEKMEVLSQLAASISHEVKNPLTVIKGFLRLLHQEHLSSEKKLEYLSIASSELNRAEDIINDYLTFAKPYPEVIEEIPVGAHLQKLMEIIGPMSHQHSVKIEARIDEAVIKGNARTFQQAFLNFMKNAVEAMPKGGTLTIRTVRERGHVCISISDTGVGMTKSQKRRLGEPYFSTKESGTGLGLLISYRIIEAMNGKIGVTSSVGQGTEFRITFPTAD